MSLAVDAAEAIALKEKVDQQGLKVRDLKTSGAEKSAVDEAVQSLLQFKVQYKELTGVDLTGGGSSKKDKKAAKKAAAPAQEAKQQGKGKQQAKTTASVKKAEPPATSTVAAASKPVEQDMSMTAVLGRLATRATQADQIIAHLKTQLTAVRQTAALTACKAEEEKLRVENEALKQQVVDLKQRLTDVEVRNGVKQVAMPAKGAVPPPQLTSAAVKQPPPGQPVSTQPAGDAQPPAPKQAKKKEKKETAGGGAGGKKAPAAQAVVDVSRLDMRIGQIVAVKKHPDADSLYVEEVDLGEERPRTIVSGLVKHVPIEQMQDRLAIFMCNLKAAKMRGILSNGMIMCGSTPEKVEIIDPPAGVNKGDRLYVEGYEGMPDEQLNPKKKIFEQVQPDLRISPDGVAVYKGVPWKVRGVDGVCTVPSMRDTPIK